MKRSGFKFKPRKPLKKTRLRVVGDNDTAVRKIKIPIKPLSVNEAWAGRRFKSAKYKQYEKDISFLLKNAIPIQGEVKINYKFYIKNYAKTDIDNLIKPILDILVKKGYIEDDRKVVEFRADKIKSDEEKIEVEIMKV